MSSTYIIAGASSAIGLETSALLRQGGHRTIGISTKQDTNGYDEFYVVDGYESNQLPEIKEPVQGLIYCPGTINLKPFNRFTSEDFLKDYSVNTIGAALVTQRYLPQLKEGKGSVVFMSSVAASTGMSFHSSISMAKAALEGLTRALAAELSPLVRVNAIAPSLTSSPLSEKFLNSPEKVEASKQRNPMKKIGAPRDVAAMAAFLLSAESTWITGQVFAVDGGMNHLRV